MKTVIYNGKLITPDEVLENKVLVLENDRISEILAEDLIDLGQYDEKIDAHGRYICPGFIDTHSDKIEQVIQPRPTSVMDFEMGLKELERQLINRASQRSFIRFHYIRKTISARRSCVIKRMC